jgi:hypothetical protein
MNLDSAAGRLPNVRFVAKFNPPLVVPFAVHMQLYQLVGIEPRTDDFRPTTFAGLALRPGELDPGMSGTTGDRTHEIRSSRTVLVIDGEGKEKDRRHDMSLYIPKLEYSRMLESLPFSHPKQLVEILPVLRQYAHATSLLRDCFYKEPEKSIPTHRLGQQITPPRTPLKKEEEIVAQGGDLPPIQLDVNLSYTPPTPRFTLHIPHPSAGDGADAVEELLANLGDKEIYHAPLAVAIDIHPNGELVVTEQNIVKDVSDVEQSSEQSHKVKRLAKVLDVADDLGVWGEWLRQEVVRNEKGS